MKLRFICFLILGSLLISSCGANSTMTLKKDGSGSVSLSLQLEKPVIEYYRDMAEFTGATASREDILIFDQQAIRNFLSRNPAIGISDLRTTKDGALFLSLTFRNINSLFLADDPPALKKIITYEQGPQKTIGVHLDKTMIQEFLKLVGKKTGFALEDFFPLEGESREEYYSNLEFALDDAAALVKNSVISVTITVDGAIVKHNGTQQGASTVRFATTLDNLLFLSTPLVFFVTFQ